MNYINTNNRFVTIINIIYIYMLFLGAWPYTEAVSKGADFEPTCMHRSNTENMLITGDTNGYVKLQRFPCISKDTVPIREIGHVKETSKVRFTSDGKYAISVGKFDRSVIVWKVLSEEEGKGLVLTDGETLDDTAGSKKAGSKKKSMKKKTASVAEVVPEEAK
jgi:hypothetical protein